MTVLKTSRNIAANNLARDDQPRNPGENCGRFDLMRIFAEHRSFDAANLWQNSRCHAARVIEGATWRNSLDPFTGDPEKDVAIFGGPPHRVESPPANITKSRNFSDRTRWQSPPPAAAIMIFLRRLIGSRRTRGDIVSPRRRGKRVVTSEPAALDS
jgi:hypothetical protein